MNLPGRHRTVLITGASGFIGSHLAAVAFSQGYLVKTLSRSIDPIPAIIPKEYRYAGNLPADIPTHALQHVDAIIHCAAWVKSGREMAEAVNIQGTLALAEIALQQKINTFIFLSSQSARPDATSDYGRSKYAAEQALQSRFRNTGLNIIILRPGLVTGPGHQGLYQRLCRMVDAWPLLPLLGGGKSIVQPIHIDDLCIAILRCWQTAGQLNGKILSLGDPEGINLAEFLQAIAISRLGYRKLTITIPIRPTAVIVSVAERLGVSLPITTANLKGLTKVEKMETKADMALVGIPIRRLEIILRDNLNYDAAVLREATIISQYLLKITPTHDIQSRYASAIAEFKTELDRDERRLWRIVERYPCTLRIIDGGLAVANPHGGIRRKIYTMLAILEVSSENCDHFLPKTYTPLQMFTLLGVGIRAGLATSLGLIFIQMMKVRSN